MPNGPAPLSDLPPLGPGDAVPAPGILFAASDLARAGEAFAMATVVWRQGPSSGKPGSRAIISADGSLRGWIGGACAEPSVIREAKQAIADGRPRLLLLGPSERFGSTVPEGMTVVPISCQSEGALEVYIEPVLPAPHLVIVGSSPMAQTLAAQAQALDWAVDLVDGPSFTADFASGHIRGRSMVVVATQGHGDEDMIARAIGAHPAYLGLVGSRKRGAAVLGYLAERGLPRSELDRVRVPAGLDLGRTTHEEMAVAILAELVQLRASGSLAPSRRSDPGSLATSSPLDERGYANASIGDERGYANAPVGDERGYANASEARDPVCGMTVPADAAHWPLEHDGVTYYFCCAGCRRAFEKEKVS